MRASLLPGLALAAAILGGYTWWFRTAQSWLDSRQAIAWTTFAAVAVFGVLAFGARRWLAPPVAAFGALALGIAHGYALARPVRIEGVDAENRIGFAMQRIAELDRQATGVAMWRSGRPPARSMPYRVSGANLRFVTGLPIGIPIHGSTYDLASVEGPVGSNGPGWERYGEGWARTLPTRRAEAEAELAAYWMGLATPSLPASEEARLWAVESLELLLVLLAFNGLALSLRRFDRKRPSS